VSAVGEKGMAFARGGCDDRMPDQKIFERGSRGPRAGYERDVSWSCSVVISKDHAGGEFLKKSLIEGILEKGPQEVLFVKTIFDTARWHISIEDVDRSGRRAPHWS